MRGDGKPVPRDVYDDYDGYLRAGSVDGWAKMHGIEQYPYYQRAVKHAAYDEFWQGQALDKLVVQHPSNVPTMWEQGLFDQEDMWGAIHSLARAEGGRPWRQQLSGDRPLAAQRRQL